MKNPVALFCSGGILPAWQTIMSSYRQLIESFFSHKTGWYKRCPAIFTLLCQLCRMQSSPNVLPYDREKERISPTLGENDKFCDYPGSSLSVQWLGAFNVLCGSSRGGGKGGDSLSSSWRTGFDGFFPVCFFYYPSFFVLV